MLVALHNLSYAAHDSADGLLAMEEVLLAGHAGHAASHRRLVDTLSAVCAFSLQKLRGRVAPGPDDAPASPVSLDLDAPYFTDSGSDSDSDADAERARGGARDGGGSGSEGSRSGPCDAPLRRPRTQRWATSADRRQLLLGDISATCQADHPWVVAFVLALGRYQPDHEPFQTEAERALLRLGLRATLGPEHAARAGPAPALCLWKLLLIALWGDMGHWAVLLLKAALLRTRIDLELVFDLFEDCLPVARAQVRATADLLFAHLHVPPDDRRPRLRSIEESARALHRVEGNVWVLPSPKAAGHPAPPGDPPGGAGPEPAQALRTEWKGAGFEGAFDARSRSDLSGLRGRGLAPLVPDSKPPAEPALPRGGGPGDFGPAPGLEAEQHKAPPPAGPEGLVPGPADAPGKPNPLLASTRRPSVPSAPAPPPPAREPAEWVWTVVDGPGKPVRLQGLGPATARPGPAPEPAQAGAGAGACPASAPEGLGRRPRRARQSAGPWGRPTGRSCAHHRRPTRRRGRSTGPARAQSRARAWKPWPWGRAFWT